MQRGEAYFLEAEAENNNGGRCLTKQTSLNWLQKYTWRDEHHPVAPWPVSKALKLLAGIRSDAFINSGYDPAFPLDDDDLQLAEALNDAERALALVLNDCEDVKHRKPRMRFFDVESIRFALRINDDVDLLEPGECLARIGNEKLPLRLYHKVGAVLFSHEYFSRDVPVFGLFHDFARERDGRAEYEEADAQIWERLKRALIVEDATEAERRGLVPWDVPSYEPLPFVEPVFSNNPCSSACSLLPAPPLPDALPSPQSSDECREVEPSKTAPPEADSPPWGYGLDPDDWPPPFDDDPRDEFASLDAPPAIETPESVKATPDADLSAAIDFGGATRDVLEVLADYLKRPPERQRSKNKNFPTEAQCVLDALDLKSQRNRWGRADDGSGRLSKAQWMSVRTLFLPETKKNQGCKGGRWGGKTDRD